MSNKLCSNCKHLLKPELEEYGFGGWEDDRYVYCKEIHKQIKNPYNTKCKLYEEDVN